MNRRFNRRDAFTLIELLVVIAIIAILIGLLLPAVQKVREAAARATCQSQLKQLALAAQNYHSALDLFPVGVAQPGPDGRYTSVFVELLPYIEQNNVFSRWNFSTPSNNFGDATFPGAAPIKILVCPSAGVIDNPTVFGSVMKGISTYGANAGTVSFPITRATNDGVLLYATTYSRNQVRILDVTDGSSNTILFGERRIKDGNINSFLQAKFMPTPFPPFLPMESFMAWSTDPGPNTGGGLMLCGSLNVNYGQGQSYQVPLPPPAPQPLPIDWGAFGPLVWNRLSAYGSQHTGGANFAFADGSVRFLKDSTAVSVLTAMSTRSGGEVFSND